MGRSDRLKLLLVDDERDITSILKRGLEGAGFEVDAFNSPVEALSQYRPGHYDIVISDIRMPGMDGFHFAREIWGRDAGARICMMTSFEIYENEARKVFPNFKTYCFIKKPITPSALTAHVRMHFASPPS